MAALSSLVPGNTADSLRGYLQNNYGQASQSNGNYTLPGFRFSDSIAGATPAAARFNDLMNQGNYNTAYSMLTTGNNAGTQLLKSALQGNPDFMGQIVNTYAKGGTNSYFGPNNTTDYWSGLTGGQFDQNGNWVNGNPQAQALQTQYQNGDLSRQDYTHAMHGMQSRMPYDFSANPTAGGGPNVPTASGTTSLSNAATTQSTPVPTASNPSGLPAAAPDYSNYITNPSAYLDPSMAFTMKQGMDQLQNSAAAQGNLLSGQTLKGIENYAQGLAGTNWQNAFNNAQADANRLYGIDNNDRNFAYNAAVNDRNFNNANQQFLSSQGLQSTNAQSSLAQALSSLLSANTIAAGQTQAGGTLGGANNINSLISSLLGQYNSQNNLGLLQGLLGNGGT